MLDTLTYLNTKRPIVGPIDREAQEIRSNPADNRNNYSY